MHRPIIQLSVAENCVITHNPNMRRQMMSQRDVAVGADLVNIDPPSLMSYFSRRTKTF